MNAPMSEAACCHNAEREAAEMAALYAALSAAQAEFRPIGKNRSVLIRSERGAYQFRYADLETILSAVRPALSKHGLAVTQTVESYGEDDYLWTRLVHSGGGAIGGRVRLPRPSNDPKAFGAVITYYRRYALSSLLAVAADDDLDENGEPAVEAPQRSTSKLPAETPPRSYSVAAAETSPSDAAMEAARGGVESYKAYWDGLDKQAKRDMAKVHAKLKAIAEAADAAKNG